MLRLPRPAVAGCLLALVLLFPARAVLGASVLELARVQDQTLPNGMRVILKSEPYWRAVALGVVIRSGAAAETAETNGVAHLVEHLLFEPTLAGKSLSLEVEEMGGQVHAHTLADFTRITLTAASQFAPELMARLAQTVFEAEFTEEQVEAEKRVILQEIAERYSGVLGRVERMIWELAFTVHPYRFSVGGSPQSLANLTLEEVNEFYRGHYVPENVALIAVGDLDPTSFFALARQHFGSLPARPRAVVEPPAEPEQTEPRLAVQTAPIPNTLLQIAWQAPGLANPREVCAMDLLFTALDRGETRLLTRELEGKQLALTSQTAFLTQRHPGLFIITALVPPDKEVEAQAALLRLMGRLRDGKFSEDELTYLKRLVYADYAFSNQSYADQVGSLAFYEAIDTYRFACDYISLINDITAEEIRDTAARYLREDNYNLIILRAEGAGTGGETV